MQSKKSVGLSISMIIMAIIALAVLFIIIAIFTNVTEKTAKNIGNCNVKGGECAYPSGNCKPGYKIKIIVSDKECEGSKNICCLKAE